METTAKGFIFTIELTPSRDEEALTRPAHLPTARVYSLISEARREEDPWVLLAEIVVFGQNEFQPVKDRRSIAVGDVIVLDGDPVPLRFQGRYRVEIVGFSKVLPEAA